MKVLIRPGTLLVMVALLLLAAMPAFAQVSVSKTAMSYGSIIVSVPKVDSFYVKSQIGYQINFYGTFPDDDPEASPDDRNFNSVLYDVRKVALALSHTCEPLHMCEELIVDSTEVSYSHERKMRPDVTVHIPIFDQQHFGHPVDKRIEDTAIEAGKILEAAGVKKKTWED